MKYYLLIAFFLAAELLEARDVNILDFGAVPDGKTLTTETIQKAIDHCAETGGGIVTVPQGTYLTTSLYLRSNVNLHLKQGAIILGSSDPKAFKGGVVNAIEIQNASITGQGKIDGQGSKSYYPTTGPRHNNLFLYRSRNITVEDITLANSSNWVFRIRECDGVIIMGIRIYSFTNENNDGIDIDGKNILISGCIIDCDDDAICLKSDNPDYIVENIAITNCIVASNCNLIKFGTSSFGGFRNVAISNCVLRRPSEAAHRKWSKVVTGVDNDTVGVAGISLEVVDGGFMDLITIDNISITGVQTPLFIRLGSRKGAGTLKNAIISNITASNESLIASSFTGIPGSYVENVIIKNVILNLKGKGTLKDADMPVPEKEAGYPASRMFGNSLPAYGLYVRHVKNLSISDFILNLNAPDSRPAVILDDCHNIRIDNFDCDLPQEGQPLFRFINSTGITLSGYFPAVKVPLLMRLEGDKCSNIRLIGNDLTGFSRIADYKYGATAAAVRETGNFK
jgi:hypothetical protein